MAKIKVTEKSHELEGSIKKGNVKPFGNSAHIPFLKEHTGKIVDVIVPNSPLYIWVFDESLRKRLIKLAKNKAESYKKDRHYLLKAIQDFSKKEFKIDSLMKVLSLVEKDHKLIKEILKIKKTYLIL